KVLHPEFRKELEPTPYPFGDSATMTTDGGLTLPPYVFLDAILYPVGSSVGMYLGSVEVTHQAITFTIADPDHSSLATGSFDPIDPPETIALEDQDGRPAGLLVSQP